MKIKFLIQTFDKNKKDDFSNALVDAVEFNKWWTQRPDHLSYSLMTFKKLEDYFVKKLFNPKPDKEIVPVGSVEFVSYYLMKAYGLHVFPKNIPKEFLEGPKVFLKRNVFNGTEKKYSW